MITLSIPVSADTDFDPMMPPYEQADKFARRVGARYGVWPDGIYRQPAGSGKFLCYLDSLSKLPLTQQERYTLEGLRRRLSFDSGLYKFGGANDGYGLALNLDLTCETWSWAGGETDLRAGGRGIIGPLLRGHIGKLSFYSSLNLWTEYVYDSLFYQTDYQPYNGVPFAVSGRENRGESGGNMRMANLPRCGLSYDAGRINLQAGIDYLRLGPAVHYPLTLSGDNAPPVTYARAILDLTHVEYYHIAGILRSQKDKNKYIYANGFNGSLFNGILDWGVNEVMIGGSTTNQFDNVPGNQTRPEYIGEEQGWEWAFFIPFVPMAFVEYYTGDKSNAALSFSLNLNWPDNFRFYGEFFIDDMLAPWSIFKNDWGNKWALTLGAQHFTSIAGRDVSATLEWSRVEPWVYTHFYGGSHRYDHFDKSLGSPIGPNSMAVTASGDIGVAKNITAGVKLTSVSSNPSARGGKITDIFQPDQSPTGPDDLTKTFLGPGTVHHLRPGIYAEYNPFGMIWLKGSLDADAASDRGRVYMAVDGGFRF
ncbi:MAG: hypothetical protein FWB85_06685 [Chitinispirillia bacterium]|nr:hypothetical protein [Chitinispirillia bacterium]MCL2241909.1 hypothetical protein [Chitinispirillia bacterium]